jgi:DNA-binding Lrp family transcriptional regulator
MERSGDKTDGVTDMADATLAWDVKSLTANDQKLIAALHQNGRATHVELSKQLGLHVSTIAKRMQQLEADGIISIKALPNPFKLGYQAHAVIALETDHHEVDAICTRLNSSFNVNLVVTTFGRFDVIALVFFPAWGDLLDFISEYLSSINGILSMETYFVKETRKRYYGFPVGKESPVKIDDVDQRLIEKLSENGRYTAQFLARELGISQPTCLKRLSFLLNEKVIEIRAVPIRSGSGYTAYAFMLLQVSASKFDAVCRVLNEFPDIFLILGLYNGYDILIGLNAANSERLYQFVKKHILSIDGIASGTMLIRAEVKKRYYGRFIEDDKDALPQYKG